MNANKFHHTVIEDFIRARKERKAKSTIGNYKSALRYLDDYCKERDIEIENIKNREMDTFVGYLQENVSEITAANYLGCVSEFYKWVLLDSDRDNPVEVVNPDLSSTNRQHTKPTLGEEQVKNLVESATDLRGRALLSLMATTGMRLKEACTSKISKLDLEERELEIMTVKTDFGERTVYFDRKTRRLLDKYINGGYRDKYHLDESDYIFISANTNQHDTKAHISTDVGRRIFVEALEESDIEIEYEEYSDGRKRNIFTTHILRRSFCQNWIDNDGDIMSLRNLVGWKNLEMAKEYIDDEADVDKRDKFGIRV